MTLELAESEFTAQGVSNLLNAFAKLECKHTRLFERMSAIAQHLPRPEFSAQVMSLLPVVHSPISSISDFSAQVMGLRTCS